MSAELIATLSCFLTLGIGMFAGFAWVVRRMDAGDERLEQKLTARLDAVEAKTEARFDAMNLRIDALGRDLTDVKVSVARIEGTPRHLQLAK